MCCRPPSFSFTFGKQNLNKTNIPENLNYARSDYLRTDRQRYGKTDQIMMAFSGHSARLFLDDRLHRLYDRLRRDEVGLRL